MFAVKMMCHVIALEHTEGPLSGWKCHSLKRFKEKYSSRYLVLVFDIYYWASKSVSEPPGSEAQNVDSFFQSKDDEQTQGRRIEASAMVFSLTSGDSSSDRTLLVTADDVH